MFKTENFTIIDQAEFQREQDSNRGQFPRSRHWKKYINRGFVILDKPTGPTSHDVVATVKKILALEKAGHSGTLDPAVSGVLPIGLQDGTKILSVLSRSKKRYICNLYLFGDVPQQKYDQAIEEFQGQIYQYPPLKSNVARRLRKRTVYNIRTLDNKSNHYLLDITCEAGTYIRTLCKDLGRVLGTGGKMKELRRISSANFGENETITLHQLFDAFQDAKEGLGSDKLKKVVRPIEEVLSDIPAVIARNNAIESITNGSRLAVPGILGYRDFKKGEIIQALSPKGELIALGEAIEDSTKIAKEDSGLIFQPNRVIFNRDEY